jgi:hypothetical protein
LRTRLLALASAASLPIAAVAITLSAPAASAAPSACGHYPPGNAYGLRGNSAPPARGQVRLSGRVFYPASSGVHHCGGKTVVFFVSGAGEYKRNANGTVNKSTAKFHKSATDVSDADGLVQVFKTAPRTTRQTFLWYAAYTSDNHTGTARTAVFQVGR